MCWNDNTGNGVTLYHYDRCCDIRFGPKVRSLPAFWTQTLELEFQPEVRMVLGQAPVQTANRSYSWDPNGVVTGKVRRWAPLYGVVWEDRAARVILSTRLMHFLHTLHGRPLIVLDIASGLGINTIAAAKSKYVEFAVGIDADASGVIRAKGNARRNNASNAHILHFDVCNSVEAFGMLLNQQVAAARGRRIRFDLVTMSGLHAPARVIETCAYELLFNLGGPMAAYLESDALFFGGAYKYGAYPGFADFASRRGFPVLHKGRIDLATLHGTDEPPFLPIMPVDIWMFAGLTFMDRELPSQPLQPA